MQRVVKKRERKRTVRTAWRIQGRKKFRVGEKKCLSAIYYQGAKDTRTKGGRGQRGQLRTRSVACAGKTRPRPTQQKSMNGQQRSLPIVVDGWKAKKESATRNQLPSAVYSYGRLSFFRCPILAGKLRTSERQAGAQQHLPSVPPMSEGLPCCRPPCNKGRRGRRTATTT